MGEFSVLVVLYSGEFSVLVVLYSGGIFSISSTV